MPDEFGRIPQPPIIWGRGKCTGAETQVHTSTQVHWEVWLNKAEVERSVSFAWPGAVLPAQEYIQASEGYLSTAEQTNMAWDT